MKLALTVLTLWSLLLAPCFPTHAQLSSKIPRIGFLSGIAFSSLTARIEALRQGLRELGYIEGKNIVIDWRSAEGKNDRLAALAAELVTLKVDIIVSAGPAATRSAKEATRTIPILMTQDDDPVAAGFVTSLARPGGNVTGLSAIAPELSGKRLELLREVVPNLSRVAVLETSTTPGYTRLVKELDPVAKAFKVQLQYLDVLESRNLESAFQAARKGRADGVLALTGGTLNSQRAPMAMLAAKSRLPAMYRDRAYVEDGGLMSYGPSMTDLFRRAATYVDKILKGARPVDLPIEQPIKFEFFVDLKAAKQIGLTIPPDVLARADRVIR